MRFYSVSQMSFGREIWASKTTKKPQRNHLRFMSILTLPLRAEYKGYHSDPQLLDTVGTTCAGLHNLM